MTKKNLGPVATGAAWVNNLAPPLLEKVLYLKSIWNWLVFTSHEYSLRAVLFDGCCVLNCEHFWFEVNSTCLDYLRLLIVNNCVYPRHFRLFPLRENPTDSESCAGELAAHYSLLCNQKCYRNSRDCEEGEDETGGRVTEKPTIELTLDTMEIKNSATDTQATHAVDPSTTDKQRPSNAYVLRCSFNVHLRLKKAR